MAKTFEAAFEAAQCRELDLVVGLEVPPRTHAPVDDAIARNFADCDYRPYERMARILAWRCRCDVADGEDEVQQAFLTLLEKERPLYNEDPARWRGRVFELAESRLRRGRRNRGRRPESIEALLETAGDAPFKEARRCLPISLEVDEGTRYTPPPGPGQPWTERQAIAAFQRFRDHHGWPPRARDCQRLHRLPGPSVIRRLFGSHEKAILAAGMTPPTLGQRRRHWTAVEVARACRSFRRRNGRWPDSGDLGRNPGELPSAKVMMRYFGSTKSAAIQCGVEGILANVADPPRRCRR